jgi:predicted branched-subunit amino acid permease
VFIILNMKSLWRTTESALLRDVALICLADALVGAAFGATSVAGGLPWWVPVAMSLLIFAGGSQFAAVSVVLAGGSPLAAVAAGAVLNTRLLPYGLAVADVVGPADGPSGGPSGGRWWTRLVGAHVVTDESVAFALRQADPAGRRAAFWTCGVALFAAWNVAVILGVLAGSAIKNTNAFGLDATFPAVLIALALTPVLPAGLPVLAALGGLATGWRPHRRMPAATATATAATAATAHGGER